MQIQNKVVVVTGAARGIGRALCERFVAEGARGVVVSDIDTAEAEQVAANLGEQALAIPCDVADQAAVTRLVEQSVAHFGQVDVFCSNAGITVKGGVDVPDADWQRVLDVNVMSHIYAARAVLPRMLEQGGGWLLQTVSAAGLLTEIGSAPYSMTKHAALGLAEWLAVHHQRQGIGVSVICPLGVETDMLDHDDPVHQFLQVSSIQPEDVAEAVINGLEQEDFLILPHPGVLDYFRYKADDYDRWLKAFSRLHQKLTRQLEKRRQAAASEDRRAA